MGDHQISGPTNQRTYKSADRQISGPTNQRTDKSADRQISGPTNQRAEPGDLVGIRRPSGSVVQTAEQSIARRAVSVVAGQTLPGQEGDDSRSQRDQVKLALPLGCPRSPDSNRGWLQMDVRSERFGSSAGAGMHCVFVRKRQKFRLRGGPVGGRK